MSTTDSWRGVANEEKEEDLPVGVAAMMRRRSRRLLGSLMRPHLGRLFATSLLTLVNLGSWLLEPFLVGRIIDIAIKGEEPRALVVRVIVLGVVLGLNNLTFGAYLSLSGRIGQDILLDLRKRVFKHFQKLSLAFHERYTSGRVIARLTSDIDALSELLQTGLRELVTSVLVIIGITAIMLGLDLRLALVTLVFVPLVLALTWWFRKHAEPAYRAVRNAVALVIVFYNESLGGIRAVQAFRREPRNKEIFEGLNQRYKRANLDSIRLAGKFGPGVTLLGSIATATVLLYGGNLALDGSIGVGELTAFLLYLGRFFGPLQDLSQFYNVFQAASAALEKLGGVLEEEPSVPEPLQPALVPEFIGGEVVFDAVTFAYREKSVLHDVSFVVPASQTVALVGQTGAGKTTIGRLIARFYDPTEGRVTLDGINLREFTDERLRQAVTVVTQESFLFSGTVAENIAFGKPGASREEVEAAAAAIGAHEFIAALPDGYDTDVKKRGGRLSQGQKQLVSFARAFLADPSILILDEATSSLDIPTERLVQHALRTLLADRTAFIIAHRLTTVEIADRVLVIDDGRIVEDGAPRELLAEGGRYRALHEAWAESLV